MSFTDELESLINKHSRENESNTPDFILAKYIESCLVAFETASIARDRWYGISPSPGQSSLPDGPVKVPPAAETKAEVESAPTLPAPVATPLPLPPVPDVPAKLVDFDNECEDSEPGVPF